MGKITPKYFTVETEADKIAKRNEELQTDVTLHTVRRRSQKSLERDMDFEKLFLRYMDERRSVIEEIMRKKGTNRRVDAFVINAEECCSLSGLLKIKGDFYLGCDGYFEPIPYGKVYGAIYRNFMRMGIGATEARKIPQLTLLCMEDHSAKVGRNVIRFSNIFYDFDKGTRRKLPAGGICMYAVPWSYRKNTKPNMFMEFLERILPDEDDRMCVQEFFAMAYIDRTKISIEKFMLMIGTGANGKSVLLNVITAVVGAKYVCHLDPTQMKDYKQVSVMGGKRLNIAPDVRSNAMFSSAMKTLVSGEDVEAWEMYKGNKKISAPPIVFSMNEMPKTEDSSNGMARRMLPIYFGVTIPEEEQDKALATKIIEKDKSGIFDWLMEGRKRLLRNKGVFTQSVKSRTMAGEILNFSVPILELLGQRGLHRDEKYVGQEPVYLRAKDVADMFELNSSVITVANHLRDAGFSCDRVASGFKQFRMYDWNKD